MTKYQCPLCRGPHSSVDCQTVKPCEAQATRIAAPEDHAVTPDRRHDGPDVTPDPGGSTTPPPEPRSPG